MRGRRLRHRGAGRLPVAALATAVVGLLAVAVAQLWPAPSAPAPGAATPSPAATASPTPPARATAPEPAGPRELAYRVEVRTDDPATADFAEVVERVLADPRGWRRAGFDFVRHRDGPYRLVLAEGAEVDRLCDPYETGGRFSCQNGPVVAINADRWRHATAAWPGDLRAYRTMLINHEVGHLLHLHHPEPQCPGPGLPAPVMAQQSSGPGACRAHPWPLQWEAELAAERREPLAPGADHDPTDHRPEPPPARR